MWREHVGEADSLPPRDERVHVKHAPRLLLNVRQLAPEPRPSADHADLLHAEAGGQLLLAKVDKLDLPFKLRVVDLAAAHDVAEHRGGFGDVEGGVGAHGEELQALGYGCILKTILKYSSFITPDISGYICSTTD